MDVAAVGWAQVGHSRAMPQHTDNSLLYEVATAALGSCGLGIGDIDVVINAGSDFLDGRGISTCITADAMGAQFKEESKVSDDGMLALIYAYMRLASGLFDTALVVAYGKSSESSVREQTAIMAEPFYLRPLGVDAVSTAALQARSYMHHYGTGTEAPAKVVAKNRAAGVHNPHAQLRSPVTVAEVMGSEELVSPIRKMEACPSSDGACAVVLACEPQARALKVRPAWISGVGFSADTCYPGTRPLHRAGSAAAAAKAAYEQAGVTDPASQLDLVEVSEFFAYQELLLYEALGLCGDGEAEAMLDSGGTRAGGSVPVNLSGGALCANPLVATGLVRFVEAASRVAGRSEGVQVGGARRALAHAGGGFAMQAASVAVVES